MANIRAKDLPQSISAFGNNDYFAADEGASNQTKKVNKDSIRAGLGLATDRKTVVSVTNPTPDFVGQPGVDASGNNYVAISLTGTMWKNLDSNLFGSVQQILRLHNPALNFQGFAVPNLSTPGSHVLNNAWIVTESGTIFGISAVRGQIIRDDGTNYRTEEVDVSYMINLLASTIISNGFIDTTGANNGSDSNWKRTDYIPVTEGLIIKIKMYGHTAINAYSFYDNALTYVSGYHAVTNNELVTKIITVPSGVSYIRFSYASEAYVAALSLQYFLEAGDVRKVNTTMESVLDFMVNNKLDYGYNIIFGQTLINGYIGTSGTVISSDANWRYTDYLSVNEGDVLEIKMWGHNAINSYSLYDENKNYISGGHSSASLVLFFQSITIPSGVSFIRFSFGCQAFVEGTGRTYYAEANLASNVIPDITDLKFKMSQMMPKKTLDYITPHKIYTVCNNIISALKGNNRNYAAALYLDHLFDGLTEEKDIKFEENKSDRVLFYSPIEITNSSYNVVYNTDGSAVKTATRNIVVTGNDVEDFNFNVSHISTLADANKTTKPRILCIGDSITYGELATFPSDTEIQSYSLLTKQLFEMDKIDGGDVAGEYNALLLGIFKRTLNINYSGINRTITACHQGIPGATLDHYLNGTVSYFYNGSRFSLKPWIDLYRTMNDSGVRLTAGDPAIGSAVTNVNDYDVCVPTHVVIMLGTNGSETASQYVSKIQSLIDNIKLDCTTYGWTQIFISVVLPDCAGTYFPSKHPNFDKTIAIWNDNGAQPTRHPRLYTYVKQWMVDKLSSDTEVADKTFLLPFWWVMPTAESACIREIPFAEHTKNYFYNEGKNYNKYGWYPTTHLNPNAHWSFAYQLYSWIKYTLTL